MRGRTILAMTLLTILGAAKAQAQDVPGIEICTVEKTMERRTSCLQSNINFLQQTLGKLRLDQQQRLDAANRQVEALKATVVALQKTVEELQAAQRSRRQLRRKLQLPRKTRRRPRMHQRLPRMRRSRALSSYSLLSTGPNSSQRSPLKRIICNCCSGL